MTLQGSLSMRISVAAALGAVVSLAPVVTAAPAYAAEMCQGQDATIVATDDGQRLAGTDGADVITTGSFRRVEIHGKRGGDVICGDEGRAFIHGGQGHDTIVNPDGTSAGGSGRDDITMTVGVARGGGGDDTIAAFESHAPGDRLRAFGGDGDDDILAGGCVDPEGIPSGEVCRLLARGGLGTDVGSFDMGPEFRDFRANMRSGVVTYDGGSADISGFEELVGGPRRDRIFGTNGRDVLRGGPGNDLLYGRGGDDRLYGGAHTNGLFGGPGFDTCRSSHRSRDCER